MNEGNLVATMDTQQPTEQRADRAYEAPRSEILSLSCEISAYAPDGDDSPLF